MSGPAPIPAKLDYLVVLSLERTASTSVSRSLRYVSPQTPVVHVHFVDSGAYHDRPTNAVEQALFDSKHERQRQVQGFLADPTLKGAVFTILRDRPSRIASCLWYAKHDVIKRFYDADEDRVRPEVMAVLEPRTKVLLDKDRDYDRNVYALLGLKGRPEPGVYPTTTGATLFALDFRRIAQDFETATQTLFGAAVILRHENRGGRLGDPRGYLAFKRLCAEALTQERLALGPDAS